MNELLKKKKTVSYSQFSNWWTCPAKWHRDYILHEKEFEDNLIMTFGTAIHEAIQDYIKTLYKQGDKEAESLDLMAKFMGTFKREIEKKGIKHTPEEFNEFVEDAKNVLSEFAEPANRLRYFPRDKWELLGIEDELKEDIINNVTLDAKLDLVLREKLSGDIRIIDIKTSNNGWNSYQRENWIKNAQLLLYKAVYSKRYNIPLSKINVEFFILKRKVYENCNYEQSRIQIFKPISHQKDILKVIQEFRIFVNSAFTSDGQHNLLGKYPKIPGLRKSNCKFCPYAKNKKCDQISDGIEEPIDE